LILSAPSIPPVTANAKPDPVLFEGPFTAPAVTQFTLSGSTVSELVTISVLNYPGVYPSKACFSACVHVLMKLWPSVQVVSYAL